MGIFLSMHLSVYSNELNYSENKIEDAVKGTKTCMEKTIKQIFHHLNIKNLFNFNFK